MSPTKVGSNAVAKHRPGYSSLAKRKLNATGPAMPERPLRVIKRQFR
jgi:hypothetical protein